MAARDKFGEEYKKLNPAQKEAVDAIDGPVMVVAGPGTGKTQILALRIGNILRKTDIKADGVLCLTFTNSAVEAMKARLKRYIGEAAEKVNIFTFHSFGMKVIDEHCKVLGFPVPPKLLEDADRATLFDEILNGNDWQYLRPRGDSTRYYFDLKSIISLLKRERVSPEYFLSEIEKEIKLLAEDPENLSTRGESKGKLKKEFLSRIEGLERTKEIAKFINLYEKEKNKKNVVDYDDVLEGLVKIVETSDQAAAGIRERYLYVLVDEHQDSSLVQNEFLQKVWSGVEKPDIFVVGDDRQLIYGFSGASIEHFKNFKKVFKGALLVPLVDNYRSTQIILDASHALLKSVMSEEKLISHRSERHPVRLIETEYPDDEITACALDIKEKLSVKGGLASGGRLGVNDCAILVPKNAQVRRALEILHGVGLPVSSLEALDFFDQEEAQLLLRVLKIINDPEDGTALALAFFGRGAGIAPIEAYQYLIGRNMHKFSLSSIAQEKPATLFAESAGVEKWVRKLVKLLHQSKEGKNLSQIIKIVGEDLFAENKTEGQLVSQKEILDTILKLALAEEEKNPNIKLSEFLAYLDRLESYGEHLPLAIEEKKGVKVLTLHSSKGLEFDYVWIAHMDEWSLQGSRRGGFTMPLSIAQRLEERNIDAIKRKLYVAITRAKRFCTLSYARNSDRETEQELGRVIADLPDEVFSRHSEKPVSRPQASAEKGKSDIKELVNLVALKYTDKYVSASLLNNFFECPWKWYFANLLALPTPPKESLEFGIAVHSSINGILKFPHAPKKKEVDKIIEDAVSQIRFRDERIRARIGKEAQSVVKKWIKNRLPQIKLGRKTEEGISLKDERFPHLKIYGKVDLIENLGKNEEKQEVRVTDFKTGSVRKKSELEKLDEEGRMSGNLRQLALYSYLLEQSPKWKADVRESRLEFLEAEDANDSFYDTIIGKDQIDLLVKDIEDYDKLVKSGKWPERECHYNSYGKDARCEYCKLAEIYK